MGDVVFLHPMKPANPFLVAGYQGPEYFCDREKETEELVSALENDRNVTLIAPRRMGKSGLVKNVFHWLEGEQKARCAYVDIFGTQNLAEFVKAFASGVFSAFETSVGRAARTAASFLRGFRPVLTVDAFGSHSFSFDVSPSSAEATLSGVFDYLESRKFRTVVAFDEFQQVANYPEKGTEALLRSRIQFLTGHQFVFSGSRKHMMAEMFLSSRRPFYHSTQIANLGPIDRGRYFAFARGHFAKAGVSLAEDAFVAAYDRFDGITWYVQAVMNRLYEARKASLDREDVDRAVESLVAAGAYGFEAIVNGCPDGAVRLLKAVASEGCVREPTAGAFLAKHRLKAASSVSAALKTLKAADLVEKTDAGWVVCDRLFGIWLSRLP